MKPLMDKYWQKTLINEKHQEAIDCAEMAATQKKSLPNLYAKNIIKAYKLEWEAACLAYELSDNSDKTLAMLTYSAACLAHECGDLRTAEKLCCYGLAGETDIGRFRDLLKNLLTEPNVIKK